MGEMSKRLVVLVSAWVAAGSVASAQGSNLGGGPEVDHHMHIFSPEASRVLGVVCKVLGPAGCPPEVSHAPSTGDEVVQALDKAGVEEGVLLSAGYVFGSPDAVGAGMDVAKDTREENAFIVAQARAHCGRLLPFISVDPLASNAVEEIDYWGRHGGATGLKLHLASSAFDFRSPEQVQKLAAVFKAAGRNRFPIVIHLQTRAKSYGRQDARTFLDRVYPLAGGVPIQIAHAAGGGGVAAGELAALAVFADAKAAAPTAYRNRYFDLAMVPDLFANEGKISAKPDDVMALKARMRRIGLDRFLLGSDYTPGLDLKAYYADQKAALAFSDQDWRMLLMNRGPYAPAPAVRPACQPAPSR